MPAVDAIAEGLDSVLAEIRDLELGPHVAELDACGLTVLPPERVAPREFTVRLRDAVLNLAERRTGIRPDFATGATHANIAATSGQAGEAWMWQILFDDPIFADALMNRACLAMVTYLAGYSAKLSNSSALVKGPVDWDGPPRPLGLHNDSRGVPAPLPPYSQFASATWALTDYTLEKGALGYLPGSHKLCRQPTPDEALDKVVPVEARAGSLIVWHGNTWHAPFPRTAPGLRVSMLLYFCREYMTTQERYGDRVPQAMLERYPPRFRTLMGLMDGYGWAEDGPDVTLLRKSRSGHSLYS